MVFGIRDSSSTSTVTCQNSPSHSSPSPPRAGSRSAPATVVTRPGPARPPTAVRSFDRRHLPLLSASRDRHQPLDQASSAAAISSSSSSPLSRAASSSRSPVWIARLVVHLGLGLLLDLLRDPHRSADRSERQSEQSADQAHAATSASSSASAKLYGGSGPDVAEPEPARRAPRRACDRRAEALDCVALDEESEVEGRLGARRAPPRARRPRAAPALQRQRRVLLAAALDLRGDQLAEADPLVVAGRLGEPCAGAHAARRRRRLR